MSPEALAAFGGLAFTVVGSITLGAYHMGRHANRIENLETRQTKTEGAADTANKDIGDLKVSMASIKTEVEGLKDAISDGFANVSALITGRRAARPKRTS